MAEHLATAPSSTRCALPAGGNPVVAGKPEPALFDEARRQAREAAATPLVVGDRIDTDIRGASRAGLPSLLVLTGVSAVPDLCAARGPDRPTYVAPDLAGLLLAHPEVVPVPTGRVAVTGGRWSVTAAIALEGPQTGV